MRNSKKKLRSLTVDNLHCLYRNKEELQIMKQNSKKLAKPHSTENICRILLDKNKKADD